MPRAAWIPRRCRKCRCSAKTAKLDLAGRLTVEPSLDPAVQPFLYDHAIDGTPVLPGVMGMEAFAEAALAMAPGWRIEAVEGVDFLAPFKFYRGEPRPLIVEAQFEAHGAGMIAHCRLAGRRILPGQAEPQVTTHFTGRVLLAREPAAPASGPAPGAPHGTVVSHEEIYRVYFHGPAYRVLERAWWTREGAIGEMNSALPDHHVPAAQPLAIAPRLIELCFQTAGIWEMAMCRRMGLPRSVASVTLYRQPEPAAGPLYALVTPDATGESFDALVVDSAGTRFLRLTGYRTVVFRENIDPGLLAPAEAVMV